MKPISDTVVIGGGPAGMTAAIYLKRAGADVLLMEAEALGGQLLRAGQVENYPGAGGITGAGLAGAMETQVRELQIPIMHTRATGIRKITDRFEISTDSEGEIGCRCVILATGVRHRKLDIPGEERLTGKGISWCATCDGNFFRGKTVAVVGGGNTAVQEAIELSHICRKVWLLHRREQLKAERHLTDRLFAIGNIEFIPSVAVRAAIGERSLEALELEPLSGGTPFRLPVDGLFEAVGMIPQSQPFHSLVPADASGYLIAGEDCRTGVSGIFAAGDCRGKQVRQLVTAVSDGAVAALECRNSSENDTGHI